jgi:predicted ATPase/class 3 adenylate cyclase
MTAAMTINSSTEIRTLLLTDVVGSTQLSEQLGDAAMALVWQHHDRVARDLLSIWHGREIDKTDGMLLMFDHPEDAVHYAHAYHQALARLDTPLEARAGLHVGQVLLRENAAEDVQRGAKPLEVDGLAKPTAARIMALARGAQTLISSEACAALSESGLAFESHGHWLLKGVHEPVELFEVILAGDGCRAPTDGDKGYRVTQVGERWLPVAEIPNNLPQQASQFIGREKELREIKALLGSARLVTLLGMGGLGKTRMSLQAAAEVMHQFPDGVWFMDLAPITDPVHALAEAAQVLGVREEPERSLLQSVCAFLKDRRVLMIFDNCEHLIQPAAKLANALIKAAPHLRLAATSREALRISGEHTITILPLTLPKVGADVATLMQSPAVRLFVDRAQSNKASFELNHQNAAAVAELVVRLEGIPLALELAAARVRALSVDEINKRLGDRYRILTGGSRDAPGRQQTLRALVDWSYDTLSEDEKTLLNRLAIFRGGANLATIEAVCCADPIDPADSLDLMMLLVEKSLVMTSDDALGTRYRMLETIRDYAHEQLDRSGEADSVGAAHCHHFFAYAKQGRDALRGPDQGEWLNRFEADEDNLRAAIGYAEIGAGGVDPIISIKLAVALQGFWILRGHTSEGRATVARLLQLPVLQTNDWIHAHALYLAAALAVSQSDCAAAERDLQVCLALRRGLDNVFDVAATLSTLAMAKLGTGDAAGALAADLEALDLMRAANNSTGESIVLLQLGQIEAWRANEAVARAYLQSALTLAQQVKHPETEAEAELTLAQIAFESDDLLNADEALLRSLKICVAAGDRRGAANALAWLAKLDLQGGRVELARARMAEALMAFHAFDMRDQLLTSLDDHASLALALGQAEAAAALASTAQQLRSNAGTQRSARSESRWLRFIDKLAAALGGTLPQHPNWQVARGWDTARALREALRLSMPAGQLHPGQPSAATAKPSGPLRRKTDPLAADRPAT